MFTGSQESFLYYPNATNTGKFPLCMGSAVMLSVVYECQPKNYETHMASPISVHMLSK